MFAVEDAVKMTSMGAETGTRAGLEGHNDREALWGSEYSLYSASEMCFYLQRMR